MKNSDPRVWNKTNIIKRFRVELAKCNGDVMLPTCTGRRGGRFCSCCMRARLRSPTHPPCVKRKHVGVTPSLELYATAPVTTMFVT